MLTSLTIKNYALIRHLEMHPSRGLTVITGETGAGKSIMLGAVGLLLGDRADTKVLWDEDKKCIVEGTFEIKAYRLKSLFEDHDLDHLDQTSFRREISPGGKSRAFINDTPVTLDVLRQIGNRLMDLHSQHETLELGSHAFQLSLIDAFAGNGSLLLEYQQAWKDFQQSKKTYEALAAEAGKLKTEFDFIKFQLDELQKAALAENEQEELESSLKISENAEDIKSRLNLLLALLGQSETSITSGISEALTFLQPIKSFSAAYDQISQRLDAVRIELKDILAEIESEEEKIEFDPKRA
ncbi:MAG: AAA family ATPase, partial [Cyclobacteriaceae bacterium]|nr:AAA family ATPase [Cyclobacteriaceae bacterium]